MDIEKLIFGALTAGASWLAAYHGVVFRNGKDAQKREQESAQLAEVRADVKAIRDDIALLRDSHVKKTEYENDMLAVYGRLDRQAKTLEDHTRDNQKLLYEIGRDVAFIKGRMNKEARGND